MNYRSRVTDGNLRTTVSVSFNGAFEEVYDLAANRLIHSAAFSRNFLGSAVYENQTALDAYAHSVGQTFLRKERLGDI